jgi:uncharacterized protein DUF3592
MFRMSVAGEQQAGIGRPRRRQGKIAGIIRAAIFLVGGVIFLSLGISGLHNHHVLVAHGVRALARVTATSGYGRNTIQVSYPVGGRQTRGTIDVGAGSFQVGEAMAVVYDPQSPQVVAAPGTLGSASSAWTEVAVGCLFVAVVPAAFLISKNSARRRRQRSRGPGV